MPKKSNINGSEDKRNYISDFVDKEKIAAILAVKTIVISILTYLFAIYFNIEQTKGALISIVSALVVFIISQAHERYITNKERKDIIARFDELRKELNLGIVIFKFENSNELISYLSDRISTIASIKNTYIDPNNDSLISGNEENLVRQIYKNFLTNFDGRWTDVVGVKNFKSYEERIKKLGISKSVNLKLFVTKKYSATINFIIITYKNEKKEVIFGWMGTANDVHRGYFRSSNDEIVSLFEGYFDNLKTFSEDQGKDLDVIFGQQKSEIPKFVDKEGHWRTLAFLNGNVESLGDIVISTKNARFTMTANIYDAKNNWKKSAMKEITVSSSKNKLLCEYKYSKKNKETGIFVYEFEKGGDYDIKKDIIIGYILSENRSDKRLIVGVRSDDELVAERIDDNITEYNELLKLADEILGIKTKDETA